MKSRSTSTKVASATAKATMEERRALMERADRDLARAVELFEDQVINKSEYDRAEADAIAARFQSSQITPLLALVGLLLGVFASTAVNPDGADGLIRGNAAFLGSQAIGVVAVGRGVAVAWGSGVGVMVGVGLGVGVGGTGVGVGNSSSRRRRSSAS